MAGAPHFPASEGEFEVDYRSHGGIVLLGDSDWLFRTSWSPAGNGTIHTYREGAEVAVAPGVARIEDVTAEVFERADFTSRTRTPTEGEVVLWKNKADLVAAAQIIGVRLTKESEAGTVLRARYRILADGSRDFSVAGDPHRTTFDAAVARALQTYEELATVEDAATPAGVGHNQPPEAAWLVREDYEALANALRAARHQEPDDSQLKAIVASSREAATKIGQAITYRLQLMREGFYRQIGAAGALAGVLTVWLAFAGRLEDVASAAAALGTALLGWAP